MAAIVSLLATALTLFAAASLVSAAAPQNSSSPFSASAALSYGSFNAIYSFGDSIADTGNLPREVGPVLTARLPYGETFFRRATGRCSDGRLMIDFIAEHLGLPYVNPYLDTTASFANGVNFAVAGATALDASYLRSIGIGGAYTSSSLSVQLGWFESRLGALCYGATPAECRSRLSRALFLVGEIGGNDYNYAFFQGKSFEQAYGLVPPVVQAIRQAAIRVINHGARNLIVPGNFPIGCVPSYLTSFGSLNPADYDGRGCLRRFNEFSEYHNAQLQQTLQQLRAEFPGVQIQYADYYTAFLEILDNAAARLGFDPNSLFRACCGIGGAHNFDGSRMCGSPGTTVCPNPFRSISWDGIHLTEAAYRDMVMFLLQGNIRP